MNTSSPKQRGAFFTPTNVARELVRWAVRSEEDAVLDPSCGDGQFLQFHNRAFGCEIDPSSAISAIERTRPQQLIVGDFFEYASETTKKFDCVVGNPPFIRFQQFSGSTRRVAMMLCEKAGLKLPASASSWAPFVVVSASLLKPGGRLAMVIPAEIGHAKYARPLLSHLLTQFGTVRIVAIREPLFPELSQDAWLLQGDNFGKSATHVSFAHADKFTEGLSESTAQKIPFREIDQWSGRLRPFLLSDELRSTYNHLLESHQSQRLQNLARCGIGYVTGANDFFHLRPSEADHLGIPARFLQPTVRNGRQLPERRITKNHVKQWHQQDLPNLLLRLAKDMNLPVGVRKYLESTDGLKASTSYKCRNRNPWYVVPDVRVPDGFLSCMSGRQALMVKNTAKCSCTNSLHAVQMKNGHKFDELLAGWNSPLSRLSCEIEGHPLGGGMLKIEPNEAGRLALPKNNPTFSKRELDLFEDGVTLMQRWRHYDD